MAEIKLPEKCNDCTYIGDYSTGHYARNPHYCCELIWALVHEDYKVNPNIVDTHCPLRKESVAQAIEDVTNDICGQQ